MSDRHRRSFFEAYAQREALSVALMDGDFGDPDRFGEALQSAGRLHEAARDALLQQNEARSGAPAVRASLDALDAPGTVMVVTGQQPGLFGGPFLSYLKAASAISLAREVERARGVRCVPLFWVQSEDHDFDEVAQHSVLNAAGELVSVTLEATAGERVSLEHRSLGPDVERCLGAVEEALDGTAHQADVVDALRSSYRAEAGVAEAFGSFMGGLFAEDGLLVLRPRTAGVARALAGLHRRCLRERETIEGVLSARSEELGRHGFGVQVPIRAGATLGFVHPDGPAGPRYRLVARSDDGARFELAGTNRSVGIDELLAWLDEEPLAFSTSALLRPVAQDQLLPTVAYVAGPSEVAYFAQLPPLYEHFGTRAPVVVPRLRARWLNPEAASRLAGREPAPQTLADDGPVARELASEAAGVDLAGLEGRLASAVEAEVEAVRARLCELDPGLDKACTKTAAAAQRACDKLVRRATRAALSQALEARHALERLRALLRPDGVAQERVLGWTSLAARCSPERAREAVLGLDPLRTVVHELHTGGA